MRNEWMWIGLLMVAACGRHDAAIVDVNGNVYRTVTIGNQVWMAENLRVTHYRNGDPIPCITDSLAWATDTSGACCVYNNDSNHRAAYGLLYNWHAVSDPRNIAPEGWRLPTDDELITLMHHLGGDTIAAGKLKDSGTMHWLAPNAGASNESGFTALPGGYRAKNGQYHTLASNGYWWSAGRSYEMYAWSPRMYTGFADINRERYYENYGFSVRCIKDDHAKRNAITEEAVEGVDLSLNRITTARRYFPDLDGEGLAVSIKEDLFNREDVDFINRYRAVPLASEKISAHANIVATLIGGGGNTYYTGGGVAKGVTLTSAAFGNFMAAPDNFYTSYGITVQNHSYGTAIEPYYGEDAASYDKHVFQHPEMMHVFSSGNEGASAPDAGMYKDVVGFGNLTGSFKMAKNNIVVSGIDSFGNPIEYISRGPAHDGRLKPELAACTNGGSSGAAALVSGSALLMQQLYRQMFKHLPDAALVKAILINTADDAGAGGIDFSTGYGSVNLCRALASLQAEQFFTGTMQENGTQSFSIMVPDGVRELKVTLVWSDPPAMANNDHALVNDLDLTITSESGQQWLPWVLNHFPHADSLRLPAARKRDSLNNTELISIENPAAGTYTITISGSRVQQSQRYHIAWLYREKDRFRWDYPVATDQVPANRTVTLRWDNSFKGHGTLQWTANGIHWERIEEQADLSRNYILWRVPDTVTAARLRMQIGQHLIVSDSFIISSPISLVLEHACTDSVRLRWPKQTNAVAYQVYALAHKYLEPLLTTHDTTVELHGRFFTSTWLAVAPVLPDGRQGIRSVAVKFDNTRAGCLQRGTYLLFPNPIRQHELLTLAMHDTIEQGIVQIYSPEGRLIRQQQIIGTRTRIPINGLPKGIYFYSILRRGMRWSAGRFIVQ